MKIRKYLAVLLLFHLSSCLNQSEFLVEGDSYNTILQGCDFYRMFPAKDGGIFIKMDCGVSYIDSKGYLLWRKDWTWRDSSGKNDVIFAEEIDDKLEYATYLAFAGDLGKTKGDSMSRKNFFSNQKGLYLRYAARQNNQNLLLAFYDAARNKTKFYRSERLKSSVEPTFLNEVEGDYKYTVINYVNNSATANLDGFYSMLEFKNEILLISNTSVVIGKGNGVSKQIFDKKKSDNLFLTDAIAVSENEYLLSTSQGKVYLLSKPLSELNTLADLGEAFSVLKGGQFYLVKSKQRSFCIGRDYGKINVYEFLPDRRQFSEPKVIYIDNMQSISAVRSNEKGDIFIGGGMRIIDDNIESFLIKYKP
jgi:hypothetical protein